jgi:hypothetical protein
LCRVSRERFASVPGAAGKSEVGPVEALEPIRHRSECVRVEFIELGIIKLIWAQHVIEKKGFETDVDKSACAIPLLADAQSLCGRGPERYTSEEAAENDGGLH